MPRVRAAPISGRADGRGAASICNLWRVVLCACLVLSWASVRAQSALDPLTLPPAYAPDVTSPVIDPVDELRGKALLRAVRGGGYLLFMRHAHAGATLPACPDEASLTPAGETQARAVGAAIVQLKLPMLLVQSSQTCRSRDTAKLLGLGPVLENPALNPGSIRGKPYDFAQKFRFLLQPPPQGGNLILVSHVHDAPTRQDRILIDLAEVVVYRAQVGTRALPVARITPGAWNALLVADATPP